MICSCKRAVSPVISPLDKIDVTPDVYLVRCTNEECALVFHVEGSLFGFDLTPFQSARSEVQAMTSKGRQAYLYWAAHEVYVKSATTTQ